MFIRFLPGVLLIAFGSSHRFLVCGIPEFAFSSIPFSLLYWVVRALRAFSIYIILADSVVI